MLAFDLAYSQDKVHLLSRDRRLRLRPGQAVTRPVDSEQRRADGHLLVIADKDRGDQPGHIGGHLNHIGANPAVAGPGILLVMRP